MGWFVDYVQEAIYDLHADEYCLFIYIMKFPCHFLTYQLIDAILTQISMSISFLGAPDLTWSNPKPYNLDR